MKVVTWESGLLDKPNKLGHGLKKMEEDKSGRLADARTRGDALSRVTPAQSGIVSEEQRSEGGGAMIELVGFLDSGQKKSALERADCLVFPTFYENEAQPLVLLEAMSAGLPVITTSWRGVAEVLPEGYPGVVAPRSAEELAAAVLQRPVVSGNQDLRRLYEERYTIPSHVESMAEVLESTKRKAQ